ncbi:tetratricopeptide repeat protein [Hydrogenophaga sp.]|uniref:tetratricopeptide repeat protein n=1 Tax=Hydrogenophaga sp. TaxID=1904254 RepID=UPI002FC5FC38
MNKLLCKALVAGALLVHAASSYSDEPAEDAKRVFTKVQTSVVTVHSLDEKGDSDGHGSGVVIGAGLIATNCHVVRAASSLRVTGTSGEFNAKWIRQDAQRDLCVLYVEGLAMPAAKLRPSASLLIGEPVYAVGNPLGFGVAVSAGLISVIDTKSKPPVVITSAPLSPGSSGGGLFDRDGQLVGVTTAVLGTGQNINLVLSSDGLDRIATEGDKPRSQPPQPAPERQWERDATALQNSSDWTRLEALAKDWQSAKPTAADALTYLGLAQHRLNQKDEAATTLQRALALDDHQAFAWLIYGRVLKDLGRPLEANRALDRAEALQPNYSGPAAERAEWLRQEGRLDEARTQIKESLRRQPGQSDAWRILGLIEDNRGDKTEALRAFQISLRLGEANAELSQRVTQLLADSGKADEASRVNAQANQGKQESARSHVSIGLAELQRDRLGPAEDAMRKAIALAPEWPEAWDALGIVLSRSNRTTDAVKAYDRALELAADNPQMLTNRASAHLGLKRFDAALSDTKRAIAIDPKFASAWRLYGMVQMETRNFHEATTAFDKIDQLGQLTPDDLVSLGESQTETGNVELALKTLARAESMNPNLARMCLSTAKALGRKGDVEKALTYIERALKIEPTSHVAWSSKGYGLMKLGRLPEAVQALETAVSLDPNHSNSWINLGEAQLRSLNLGRAIQALEKAVVLAPQAIDARLFLGQAYFGTRQTAKSREQAERVLEKQPSFAPGLRLLVMSYLMEGNPSAARAPYLRLKEVAPAIAHNLRDQAISKGVVAAGQLPD